MAPMDRHPQSPRVRMPAMSDDSMQRTKLCCDENTAATCGNHRTTWTHPGWGGGGGRAPLRILAIANRGEAEAKICTGHLRMKLLQGHATCSYKLHRANELRTGNVSNQTRSMPTK